jgi:hypothetical protein
MDGVSNKIREKLKVTGLNIFIYGADIMKRGENIKELEIRLAKK